VNYILRKNRRILLELNRKGIENISRSILIQAGFDFNFITNICNNKDGTVFFCYEKGYMGDDDGIFILMDKEDTETFNLIY